MSTSGKNTRKNHLSWKDMEVLCRGVFFHKLLPQVSIPGSRILEKLRIREQGKLRLESRVLKGGGVQWEGATGDKDS